MILAKLEKLGGREKAFLVVAVLMAIAVLADRLVIKIIVEDLREMRAAIGTERDNLAYNNVVMECEEDIKSVYANVKDNLGRMTTPAADIDVMKGEIDDIARKSGLVVRSMKHREPRALPHYSEYIVDIGDFEGNMESMLTFLDSVQNSVIPGLLSVVHLTVGVGREGDTIKGAMTITKVMVGE